MTAPINQILLVDDEEKLLQSIAQRMKMMGFVPFTATNGMAAIDIVTKNLIDLAIVDLQMPDMNGLVTITKLKEIKPDLKTILLTGHGNDKVKQATESLNTLYFEKEEMGDFWHFIRKLNTDGNVVVIRPAASPAAAVAPSGIPAANEIEIHSPRHFTKAKHEKSSTVEGPDHPIDYRHLRIVGETSSMQELRKTIGRLAPLDCTVMFSGENGTGKELAARVIHARSARRLQRFLAIDCGDLDNAQFVHQLIGYGKVDLCEAIQSQRGIFAADQVGTLFFDRVEEMPATMQSQLLKTIDTIDRSRAAAGQTGTADIRILVATETDLAQRVELNRFDEVLYDRLIFFNLFIPPLRDRKDDILPLCSYLLRKFSDDFKKPVESIAPEVIDIFSAYPFPGNVRELAHLIERAVIIADGKTIHLKHLPGRFLEEASSVKPPEPGDLLTLAELENRYIIEVLEAAGGNKSRTAEILKISRAALWRKLKLIKANANPPH
ncbi:MAG: sigma-54 dependent transcriptional regulator [Deltaproteobacteria bacterium]|nr:sigma-54 dependent transcriptional regulator [Deltaproteobacteria bacterium]